MGLGDWLAGVTQKVGGDISTSLGNVSSTIEGITGTAQAITQGAKETTGVLFSGTQKILTVATYGIIAVIVGGVLLSGIYGIKQVT